MALNLKEAGSAVPSSEDYVKRWEGPPDSGPLSGAAKNLAQTYQLLWEQSELSALEKSHNRACQIQAPEGKILFGREQLTKYFNGYITAFPKGSFRVHHWIVNEEVGKNNRIAMRWSYSAKHTGFGSFGEPTGAPVVIMAITHTEMQEGLVVREYHAIDEVSLWMQISSYSMS